MDRGRKDASKEYQQGLFTPILSHINNFFHFSDKQNGWKQQQQQHRVTQNWLQRQKVKGICYKSIMFLRKSLRIFHTRFQFLPQATFFMRDFVGLWTQNGSPLGFVTHRNGKSTLKTLRIMPHALLMGLNRRDKDN